MKQVYGMDEIKIDGIYYTRYFAGSEEIEYLDYKNEYFFDSENKKFPYDIKGSCFSDMLDSMSSSFQCVSKGRAGGVFEITEDELTSILMLKELKR